MSPFSQERLALRFVILIANYSLPAEEKNSDKETLYHSPFVWWLPSFSPPHSQPSQRSSEERIQHLTKLLHFLSLSSIHPSIWTCSGWGRVCCKEKRLLHLHRWQVIVVLKVSWNSPIKRRQASGLLGKFSAEYVTFLSCLCSFSLPSHSQQDVMPFCALKLPNLPSCLLCMDLSLLMDRKEFYLWKSRTWFLYVEQVGFFWRYGDGTVAHVLDCSFSFNLIKMIDFYFLYH